MGYKLAGYDVIGCVEIDPEMLAIYKANHNPKHPFLMPLQEFNKLPDSALPEEFFNLDILDGSPPCSSFSMAGAREKKWGKASQFREGQAFQRLDDLFFHFIETAKRLQPKVVVAENVKGLVLGGARGYVKEIFQGFREAGYDDCQLFLLNAASMGVPQMRERTFFVANKLNKKISLKFNEIPVNLNIALEGTSSLGAKKLSEKPAYWWGKTKLGGLYSQCGADTGKMNRRLDPDKPAWTQTASPNLFHWAEPRHLSNSEALRVQSFPDDYNLLKSGAGYLCGMSVPPYMMQRIANQIYLQLLD